MWKKASSIPFYQDEDLPKAIKQERRPTEAIRSNHIRDINSYPTPSMQQTSYTPKMENLNTKFFIGNSQRSTDIDDSSKIGEWLEQEEASLDFIEMMDYQDQNMFHDEQQQVMII